jgi:hypothetical protein
MPPLALPSFVNRSLCASAEVFGAVASTPIRLHVPQLRKTL